MTEQQQKFTIIGAGCAGLSLARYAAQAGITSAIISDKPFSERADHLWGFWQMPWLDEAAEAAKASWHQWQIISDKACVTHHSDHHPYQGIMASSWLSDCAEIAAQSGAKLESAEASQIETLLSQSAPHILCDSRPPERPEGCLLQHFIGHIITADTPVFDPHTAILMDFRVDQSQGMHFIYLLPFSATEALVESTLFTDTLLDDAYYETAISTYLARHHGLTSFTITHSEKGAIPLFKPAASPHSHYSCAIGARAGAIRPSSGYGFSPIQRHLKALLSTFQQTGEMAPIAPHKPFDLWMDEVFLDVIGDKKRQVAPLFISMARALDGDAFARFMSGTASPLTYLKVIFAMPKWPFILAACRVLFNRQKTGRAR